MAIKIILFFLRLSLALQVEQDSQCIETCVFDNAGRKRACDLWLWSLIDISAF